MSDVVSTHKPLPLRVQSRCRVDCLCGWRGPLVPTFGDGQRSWSEHFYNAPMVGEATREPRVEVDHIEGLTVNVTVLPPGTRASATAPEDGGSG